MQVLERDGWTGLEEVTRLLNGHEFAVTGPGTLQSLNKSWWLMRHDETSSYILIFSEKKQ